MPQIATRRSLVVARTDRLRNDVGESIALPLGLRCLQEAGFCVASKYAGAWDDPGACFFVSLISASFNLRRAHPRSLRRSEPGSRTLRRDGSNTVLVF